MKAARKLLALVFALVAGALVAGCGGGGSGSPETTKVLVLGIAGGWTENEAVSSLSKVVMELVLDHGEGLYPADRKRILDLLGAERDAAWAEAKRLKGGAGSRGGRVADDQEPFPKDGPGYPLSREPRPLSRSVTPRSAAVFQEEGDGQVHLVALYVAVLDQDVHVLHPATLHAAQRARGAVYPLPYGILEALRGRGAYLGNSGDGHVCPLPFLLASLWRPFIPPAGSR